MLSEIQTRFAKPLFLRMVISHRLLDPACSFPQIIAQAKQFSFPHANRMKDDSLCTKEEALRLQTQIAGSVHKTAMRILSREIGSKKGVMYAETYAKEFKLADQMQVATRPCSKGFKRNRFYYQIKERVPPFNALEDFFEGPTIADCGITMDSVFFKAIADILGEERFNALFSLPQLKLRLTQRGAHASESLLPLFTKSVFTQFDSTGASQIPLGSRIYIHGVPWYRAKHPLGIGTACHSVCVGHAKNGEPLFWGLGLKSFKNEQEIVEILLQEYNRPQSQETLSLIKKLNGFFPQLISLNQGLYRYPSQTHACFENPNQPLTLETVKEYMGLNRDTSIVALSPEILSTLKSMSPNKIKTCLPYLINLQTTLISKEIIHCLQQPCQPL